VECGRGGSMEGSGELPGGRFQFQAAEYVVPRHPGDSHDLPAAPHAGNDLHARTRDPEPGGQEPHKRLVGPIVEGGSGEADAYRIPEKSRHAFPRCARQHVDRDRGALLFPACLFPPLSFQESTAARS
jgi:hypothetical protein